MSTSSLVQIQPLSQSRYEQMACGCGYRAVHVHGMGRAGNIWSDLGSEVHKVVSEYIEHLASTRQPTDYDQFDALAIGVRPEAKDGLDRVRDSLVVDPEKILGTEQYIGLDNLPGRNGTRRRRASQRRRSAHRARRYIGPGAPALAHRGGDLGLEESLLHCPCRHLPGPLLPVAASLRPAKPRGCPLSPGVCALGCGTNHHIYAQRSTASEADGDNCPKPSTEAYAA
jgi:hypothetical protein